MRILGASLSALALAAIMVFAGGAVAGAQKGHHYDGLGKSDQQLVAAARANGERSVSLILIASSGSADAVVSGLKSLGGQIRYRDDELGYIRAAVPTRNAFKAAKVSGIKSVNVDRNVAVVVPDPDAGISTPTKGHRHDRDHHGHGEGQGDLGGLGAINPYMPTGDIGAPQFVKSHRTFDGRGVKVGIVDTGVDLARPELQTALDLNGKKVPKIYDWVTTTDPALDDPANGDPTWVPMTAVTASGSSFTAAGATFRLPRDRGGDDNNNNGKKGVTRDWHFGVFSEGDPRLGGELGSDVNRDGDTTDSFGVLEDRATGTVWVDTNQNFSFADDQAMQNYKVNRDVNYFGKDDRSTKNVVESVPFTVQTDDANDLVNIGIVSGGHGTHVAGTVAGSGFFGGRYDGVAPGAQLAVARVCLFITGCASSAQIEAFLYLIKTDKVNAIQMSIGGLPPFNADTGDTSTEEYVVDFLTKKYGVQFFFSQGNDGPGANTAGSPGDANLAIGSGAYQSQATWTANYGNTPPKADTLWTFSSRGPNEDGTLKPNVVAPGSELSTWPAWNLSEAPPVGARPYQLPPGYEMIQGTSMASPMTAGAGALLLSAALQSRVDVTPAQLRNALQYSARFIPGYQAYEQGNGLIQVGAAWDILRLSPAAPAITSTAPVNTQLNQLLGLSTGSGIYEREGWAAGQSGSRSISFQGGSGTYRVTWKGDTATFSSPSTLTFSGGGATLPVTIAPLGAGIHSAIVQLDNPATPGVDYETLNTVVAAQKFTAAANYQVTNAASVDRADKKSFFVYVGPNTSVLKLDETISTGRTKLDVIDPWGDPYQLPLPCGCAEDYKTAPATNTLAIPSPIEGVWEIDVEASRSMVDGAGTALPDQSSASFTASVLGVTIAPASWTIPSMTLGSSATQAFTFTNTLAAFTGSAVGTVLGSADVQRLTANDGSGADGGIQQIPFEVPAGGTSLDVKIGNPADLGADLDLLLFDCTVDPCEQVGSSGGPTASEEIRIDSPNVGVYVAVVVDFAVPSGTTQYDYSDVVTMAGLGQVTTNDHDAAHATGSHWSATATVSPTGDPGPGRTLRGFVQVKTGTAVINQAPVDIQSVN